jgi:hypothetical protein
MKKNVKTSEEKRVRLSENRGKILEKKFVLRYNNSNDNRNEEKTMKNTNERLILKFFSKA